MAKARDYEDRDWFKRAVMKSKTLPLQQCKESCECLKARATIRAKLWNLGIRLN